MGILVFSRQPLAMSQRKRSRADFTEESDAVTVKKQRLSSVTPDNASRSHTFKKGAIYRVAMHNFVTYNDCEFFPGPLLNVVIGPNGSGKSSIVCGLVLGLGGAPKLLGRAKQIKEFIRHGSTEAWVELELARAGKNGRNVTIRRTIRGDNSSEWRLNGKIATKTDVKKIIDSVNIQIDNVCQFLPQDKVVEFAKLDQYQLLRETEKAVGPPDMIVQHESLIDMYNNQSDYKLQLITKQKHLQDLKIKNDALERDVIRFREREKLLKTVKLMKRKRPWIELEYVVKQLDVSRAAYADVKARYSDQEKKCEPLKVEIKQLQDQIKNVESSRKTKQDALKTLDRQRKNCFRQLNEVDDRIQDNISKLARLQSRKEDRLKQAAQAEQQLNTYEAQLRNLDSSNHDEKLAQLVQEFKEEQRVEGDIQERITTIRYASEQKYTQMRNIEYELKKLTDAKERQLNDLRSRNKDTYNGYIWVKEAMQRGKFKQDVYGPVLLDVTIADPYHARCFENHVPNWLLDSFICQNEEDYQYLMLNLQEQQHLKINVSSTHKIRGKFIPPDVSETLRPHNVAGFLSDFIECPKIVKLCLMANASIETAAIGSKNTKPSLFFKDAQAVKLFTPESVYRTSVSKFGNKNRSTVVYPLPEARIIRGVDMQRLEQLQNENAEIKASVQKEEAAKRELTQQLRTVQDKLTSIKRKRDQINSEAKQKTVLQRKITEKRRQLDELIQEEDVSQKEEQCTESIKKYLLKQAEIAVKSKNISHKLTVIAMKIDYYILSRVAFGKQISQKEQELYAAQEKFAMLKAELEARKQEFTRLSNDESRQRKRANEVSPLNDELKEVFKTFPDDMDALNIAITEAEVKANLNYRDNPHLIADYERRCAEVSISCAKDLLVDY